MKIRNESEYVAATFQSIFNWNDDIQIGTERARNDELRDGLTGVSSSYTTLLLWDTSCFCHNAIDAVQAIHCTKSGTSKWRRAQTNPRIATTLFSYILHKLTQLCFVIILLLPFLLTCNTLVQQVSGQDVMIPPISMPMTNSNLELDHNIFRPSPYHGQLRGPKTKKDCQVRPADRIIKSKSRIYPSNHRGLRGYSVIILSQSDNNQKISLNRSLDAPKSAVMANGSSIRRTKRNVHIAKNAQVREIQKRQHDADSQKLEEVAFEKYKDNHHMYNRIINKEKLTKLIMKGLGLKKLPDMKKANISQLEYSSKYIEYLERLRRNHGVKNAMEQLYSSGPPPTTLQILSIVTNRFNDISQRRGRQRRAMRSEAKNRERKTKTFKRANEFGTNILLHFPLAINDANDADFHYEKLDEANVRLMMLYNPALAAAQTHHSRTRQNPLRSKASCDTDDANPHPHSPPSRPKVRSHILNLKVYQLLPMHKRRQLDARRIEFENPNFGSRNEETRSQWLEFDVTDAVRGWLNKSHENLGIEIHCDKCRRIGARILSDVATPTQEEAEEEDRFHLAPVLNIIGHIGRTHREKGVQSFGLANNNNHSSSQFYHHNQKNQQVKKWPNSCYKTHQRCCRHQLDVAFKDIKGFEFIIQPKVFDAGYCRGRCPPRHNPAHHHALLQSLIWQQDHNRAPRPCCAPSKLTELEILHVDEEHSDKLKISTWSDMQVLECACS
ncbi:uncharacterized protein mav [Drosophila montana]|uniref:uncharacterized protein mav n=1 Tax=Drosophila montana TaxID=40370 RepID=UPI00313D8909